MQPGSYERDANASADRSFFAHLGAAGALGVVAAQACLFFAGLASALLGVGESSPIPGLDPLVYLCALPLVVWVVTTGVAFSILDRASLPPS